MGEADSKSPEPFGGYGFAIRSFGIKATELGVARTWQREDMEDGGANLSFTIGGKAQSKDSVRIIGESESTTDFHLHLRADDPASSWLRIKEDEIAAGFNFEDDSTPERRLKKRIYGELDQVPPTATLFWYDADWEIGVEEAWVIECTIPAEVRDQLARDIIAGVANEIRIQIKWIAGLVLDKHAPPSIATTWGLVRVEPDAPPEPLRGQVESLTWALTPPSVEELDSGDQRH